eukprot:jgi/Botrbrau1/16669/Bobra.0068s0085.1
MMNALAEKGNILDHFHTSRFKLSLRVHCSPARQSHNMSLHPGARPRQRPSRGPSMVMSKDDSIMDLRSRSLNEPSGHLSSGGLSQPVGAAIWSQLQAGLRAILPTNRETSWAAAEHVTSSSITEKQQAKPASRVTPRDREILALLVPAMLAVFLDPSMGAIDLAFIGRVGTAPLAAVGLSNLIFFFATVFFSFLIVVITPAVASAIAKDDKREASLIIAQSTWIAGVCGVALTAGVFFGAPWLIQRFGPSAEVASLAIAHLRIRAFACPAQLLLHVANGAYRGFRDTRTPLYAGAAQNAVNLLLDSLLVVSLSCSVVGAATAGTVGLSVGALAMFSMLLKNGQLDPADFSRVPGLAAIGRTLAPGIPLGFCIFAVMMSVLTATNGATDQVGGGTDYCLRGGVSWLPAVGAKSGVGAFWCLGWPRCPGRHECCFGRPQGSRLSHLLFGANSCIMLPSHHGHPHDGHPHHVLLDPKSTIGSGHVRAAVCNIGIQFQVRVMTWNWVNCDCHDRSVCLIAKLKRFRHQLFVTLPLVSLQDTSRHDFLREAVFA